MIKRIAIIGVIACLILGIALTFLPQFLLSQQSINQQIIQQLSHWTGQKAHFSNSKIISFFPNFIIELEDVSLSGADGVSDLALIKMERLQGELDFWATLSGKAKISDFKFIRPEIKLITNQNGHSNWHFNRGEIAAKLNQAGKLIEQSENPEQEAELSNIALDLGKFEIQNGTISYHDIANDVTTQWSGVNLFIHYPELESAVKIDGNAIWNGELVDVDAAIAAPLSLLAGGETSIAVHLVSKPLIMDFDGSINALSQGLLKGTAEIRSHSARHFLNWTGYQVPPGASFGPFAISGNVLGTIHELKFTDASIKLDGNESTGILTLNKRQDELLKITGTIAIDQFNISPYLAQLSIPRNNNKNIRDLIDLSFLQDLNLDLRLSAKTVKAERYNLENLAGTIRINEGIASLDIGQASIFGGTLQMVLNAKKEQNATAINLNLTSHQMNIDALSQLLPEWHITINTIGDLQADIKAFGRTNIDLLKTMTGSFQFDAKEGEITGLDLIRLANLKEDGGLLGLDEVFEASTSFDQLTLHTKMDNSIVYLEDVSLKTKQLITQLEGKANFAKNALALRGKVQSFAQITLDEEESPTTNGQEKPRGKLISQQAFIIGGTINTPYFTPDFISK